MGEQAPDRGDILARQLDQQQRAVEATVLDDLGVDGLDQAGFAHAARAPEQGVVRRTALGKAQGVFQQCTARALDPEQQVKVDTGHTRHRFEPVEFRTPDKGAGRGDICGRYRGGVGGEMRGQRLQRLPD